MTATATETKRARRTHEQIVADLQAKIDAVRARAAANEAKADPQGKALLFAAKALDKASEVCTGEVKRSVESARAVLAEQMAAMGIRAPQKSGGRRTGNEAA